MQNLTFGGDGGLTKACEDKHPDAPWLCFMSPHMQDIIATPFFVFNSKYDARQLAHIIPFIYPLYTCITVFTPTYTRYTYIHTIYTPNTSSKHP